MTGFPSSLFAGARFAVVGLGRNGLPAARALAAMGAEVLAWDDDPGTRAALNPSPHPPPPGGGGEEAARALVTPPLPLGEGLGGGVQRGTITVRPPHPGDHLDALILSPGIPHRLPRPHPLASLAIAEDWPILSDAEVLFRAVRAAGSKARFAGITGTNGKSTTTALLADILQEAGIPVAAGGNLGTAALALPLLGDSGVYVLEMSSYMLERIATLHFDAGAMLNLSPDHLDRHGDMAGYAAVKRAVFARQAAGDLAVVGIDDEASRLTAAWLRTRPAQVAAVSGETFDVRGAPALPGAHNAQNAAAASAMALALGASPEAVAHGIASFPGLPHRQQRVGRVDGIAFVNDSKATNADAAARALGCYDRLVWIVGGQAKAGGIEPLAPYFPRIAHALLIGRDAPALSATLARRGVSHEIVGTLDAAVPAALAAARATHAPTVLLSPACASFDQFSGFDARGARFAALVGMLSCERAA